MELGSMYVKLAVDATQFQKAIQETANMTSSLASRMQKTGAAMGQLWGKVAPAIVDVGKRLAEFGAAGGAALVGVGGAAIKMAADWEQSRMAFTTMLGSAQQADSFLRQLADFAARTPFELQGLQNASRQLLAFGFKSQQIIPMMTAIGDAIAALGGGAPEIDRLTVALGQMQAKGKVSAEEMMQLAELGIPAWDMLAQKIGVSVPQAMDMAAKGAIPAAQGIEAILQGMTERFGGAMQQQSQTINGLWSTLKDTGSMVLRDIGTQLVETFDLRGKLQGLVDWLTEHKDQIANFITQAIQAIGNAWDWFSKNVWPLLQQGFTWVQTNVVPVLQSMSEKSSWVATTWQTQVLPALQNLWSAISKFVELVKLAWSEFGDDIVAVFKAAWDMVWGVLDGAFKIINGLLDVFIGLFTGNWRQLGQGLKEIWQGVWQAIGSIVEGAWNLLKAPFNALWEALSGWFGGLWNQFKEWGANLIRGLALGIASVRIPLPSVHISMGQGPLGIPVPNIQLGIYWESIGDLLGLSWLNQTSAAVMGTGRAPARFATGGIINSTILMTDLATGAPVGIAGEAGPEAIVPLSRGSALTDSIAQAVYQAVRDALRVSQVGSSPSAGDREIVLRIDGRTFARAILPAVIAEGQRQGLNLVVRPQGA